MGTLSHPTHSDSIHPPHIKQKKLSATCLHIELLSHKASPAGKTNNKLQFPKNPVTWLLNNLSAQNTCITFQTCFQLADFALVIAFCTR
ncbi:hypothetical protein AT05_07100 [Schleiferia thermophila str. Yellowstone]|jgi:hypothetical protein|nr:hypothetical protein AT05_07100 [Schleiferia thermophila str. Yellowstone]PMB37085.1 hypothetical protein CEN47_08110 [Fischerella thermalis CCMEE 5319]